MDFHCRLVKEIEIPKVPNKEADEVMDNLMTLAQNTAVSPDLHRPHNSLLDHVFYFPLPIYVINVRL